VSRTDVPLRGHPDLLEMRDQYERANAKPASQGLEGLAFLTGLYLAVSPWIVGFHGQSAITVNNLIMGLAVVPIAFALSAAFGRTHGLSWVLPVIGAWTVIAPWVMRGVTHSHNVVINNIIAGGLLFLIGLALSLIGMRGGRAGKQAASGGRTAPNTGYQDRPGMGQQDRPGMGYQDRPEMGHQDRPETGYGNRPGSSYQDRPDMSRQDRPGRGRGRM
jgi:hypothetical protein